MKTIENLLSSCIGKGYFMALHDFITIDLLILSNH